MLFDGENALVRFSPGAARSGRIVDRRDCHNRNACIIRSVPDSHCPLDKVFPTLQDTFRYHKYNRNNVISLFRADLDGEIGLFPLEGRRAKEIR